MDRLAQLNHIPVKQRIEILEVVTGIETNNKYDICEPNGRPFLRAQEESDFCCRNCFKSDRPFVIYIYDFEGRQLVRIEREFKCRVGGQCCSCSSCCLDCVTVEMPPGNIVGYVRQEYSACNVSFSVRDDNDATVLYLQGPSYCLCTCPGTEYRLRVLSADRVHDVGEIYKRWGGFARELLTDADKLGLRVPADMALETKVTLIGAILLLDFMFFEDKKNSMSLHNI